MDQFAAKWLSKTEEDMKPLRDAVSDFHSNPFSVEHLSLFPSPGTENDHQVSHQTGNPITSSRVLISSSSPQRTGDWNLDSSFPCLNAISFGHGDSKSMPSNTNEMCTKSNCHVKSEAITEISFSAPVVPNAIEELYGGVKYDEPIKVGGSRTPLQAQDHIIAERKRRQNLSECFISLSAMVPGLKKWDKASVLGGATKYLKELEERVKVLEEERKKFCKRTRPTISGDTSSSDVDLDCSEDFSSPEIDVKISGENVLLRVYCQKTDGVVKEILYKVENLNLSVINSSAMPFGKTSLHITIVAQMDGDFGITAQGLAETIRDVILKLK